MPDVSYTVDLGAQVIGFGDQPYNNREEMPDGTYKEQPMYLKDLLLPYCAYADKMGCEEKEHKLAYDIGKRIGSEKGAITLNFDEYSLLLKLCKKMTMTNAAGLQVYVWDLIPRMFALETMENAIAETTK